MGQHAFIYINRVHSAEALLHAQPFIKDCLWESPEGLPLSLLRRAGTVLQAFTFGQAGCLSHELGKISFFSFMTAVGTRDRWPQRL